MSKKDKLKKKERDALHYDVSKSFYFPADLTSVAINYLTIGELLGRYLGLEGRLSPDSNGIHQDGRCKGYGMFSVGMVDIDRRPPNFDFTVRIKLYSKDSLQGKPLENFDQYVLQELQGRT